MSKWKIEFTVDGADLEPVLAVVTMPAVDGLRIKQVMEDAIVVEQAEHRPAWQLVAEMADDTPRPLRYFTHRLEANGYSKGTLYNAVNKAMEHRAIRRTSVKGVSHFVREKVKA